MSQEPFPPGMMFRSFLTVASAFVLTYVGHIALTLGIGINFYPAFAETFEAGHEALELAIANNPEQLIPPSMFWAILGLTALVCMAVGFYVIKTAPFSHFNHAIFAAVLLFVFYLQVAIEDPPGKKSMTLFYMVVFPLALLVGAKWTVNRTIRKFDSEEEKSRELLN